MYVNHTQFFNFNIQYSFCIINAFFFCLLLCHKNFFIEMQFFSNNFSFLILFLKMFSFRNHPLILKYASINYWMLCCVVLCCVIVHTYVTLRYVTLLWHSHEYVQKIEIELKRIELNSIHIEYKKAYSIHFSALAGSSVLNVL